MRHFLHTLTLLLLSLPIRAQELDPLLPWQQGKSCGEVCLEMCGDSDEFGSLFSSGSSIFLKTNGGDTVQIGTKIDLSSPSVYVDEKTRSDDALVWFENADYANVAFDNDSTWEYHKRAALSDQYEFFVAGKYVIPWVATSPGRIVKVNARPGKGFNYTDLRFVLKTASGHIELNAEKNADGTYTLSVPGTEPANETHIYAIARPKDGRPFENVGRLKVACLEHRDQKVVLVPLARNLTIDRTAIERLLNRIYGKLGYTFSVSYDSDKAHTSGLAGIDSLNIGSGLLTEYSDEMKRVADTYIANISMSGGEIDKEAVFLFLMNSASDPSTAGIMPQKHPFGFIFMNGKTSNDADLNRTIAHELGHGLWGLDHTFSSAYAFPKGSTTHLMDYAGGTYLAHFEWLQINKPVLSWSLFNSDEGNENLFDFYHWIPDGISSWDDKYQDAIQSGINENLLEHVESNNSTYTNFKGVQNLNKFSAWAVERDEQLPNEWMSIMEGETVKFKKFKANHIYAWSGNVYTNTKKAKGLNDSNSFPNKFTYLYIYSFEDSPTISNYRISDLSKLSNNTRVRSYYYGDKYGAIAFFSESGNLQLILQFDDSSKDKKAMTESWAKILLCSPSGNIKTEEYKEYNLVLNIEVPSQPHNHYIVVDSDARLRESTSPYNSKVPKETLTKATELTNVQYAQGSQTVVRCKEIGNETLFYTSMSNLKQIEIIADPFIDTIKRTVSSYILPYSSTTNSTSLCEGKICKVIAKCGEYYRVLSSDLPSVGSKENSKGY